MAELRDRRLDCRVHEYAEAELKPKIKTMVGELLRLGVPKEGVNAVVESILGMADFKVHRPPTLEEIEKIMEEDDVT